MSLFRKLVTAMREAGYIMFTIKHDKANPGASLIIVEQEISRLGTHPSFWDVLDRLGLDGRFGSVRYHQVNRELPEGTYLTFV